MKTGMKNLLKLTLVRSKIGRNAAHLACLKGLGLCKLGHTVTVPKTPQNLGMVLKTGYMLKVEEI
jgi:large subunit ribosomal protein L30